MSNEKKSIEDRAELEAANIVRWLVARLKPTEDHGAVFAELRNRIVALVQEAREEGRQGLYTEVEVLDELERATAKFPTWPTDPLHALAVLGEEFGELMKAVLQSTYEPDKSSPSEVREEAIQTAAMALRFVNSLNRYQYEASEQHEQESPPT